MKYMTKREQENSTDSNITNLCIQDECTDDGYQKRPPA